MHMGMPSSMARLNEVSEVDAQTLDARCVKVFGGSGSMVAQGSVA